MKRFLIALALLLVSSPLFARGNIHGWVERGGQTVITNGSVSTTKVQASYPGATVTILKAGTATPAVIYATSVGAALPTNTVTASSTSFFDFWTDEPLVDLTCSGGGITTPFTIRNVTLPGVSRAAAFINVADSPYSAVGDGSDETSKIQLAVTALNAAGGGTLWFPYGTTGVYGVRTIAGSTVPPTQSLITFTALNGVAIAGAGATINDLALYYFSVSSLTSSGTTATATTSVPHGLATGNSIAISGANQPTYNGIYSIIVTGLSTFTYTFGGGASPATGTIEAVADGNMIGFVGCKNIRVSGISFTATRKPDYNVPHGLAFITLRGGGSDFEGQLVFDGGHSGLNPIMAYNDPESKRFRNIRAQIKADHTERPYFDYYAGTNADILLDATFAGRDFIILGSRNTKIVDHSVDQQGASALDMQSGVGMSDIDVQIYNRNSTLQIGNPQLIIQWADQTAATLRRVKISIDHFSGVAGVAGIEISKINNAGGADAIGRGHIIDGLDITGTIQTEAATQCIYLLAGSRFGDFGPGATGTDKIWNMRIHDLACTGSTTASGGISFDAGDALQNPLEVSTVWVPSARMAIVNTTVPPSVPVYRNVMATDLTVSNADTSPQIFMSSLATGGTNTSTTAKQILMTQIGSVNYGLLPAVTTFANLPAAPNGTMLFCSDCNATCSAGTSTGRTCFRENGAWVH